MQPKSALVALLVQHYARAMSAQDADVGSDAVPAQRLESAVLQHLRTLGPGWKQQLTTLLAQLPHGTRAQANQVTLVAYVRGVSSTSLPLRAGGSIQPKAALVTRSSSVMPMQ